VFDKATPHKTSDNPGSVQALDIVTPVACITSELWSSV